MFRNVTMTDMTDAARQQLRDQGYKVVMERFGPPATGKTTAAEKTAKRRLAQGQSVVIEDDIFEKGQNGVRVWAKA